MGVILILAGVLGLVLSLFVWGPLNPSRRRRSLPLGYDGTVPVVEERRIYHEQPPVVEERLSHQEQPPVVEERRIFRDQSPL